ncbi:MAG TPA: hypothetical protein VFJ97_04205 [Dermatophilaceae bacterium]|nr:hypothetical protein [Dermatophilaceae bacterium]
MAAMIVFRSARTRGWLVLGGTALLVGCLLWGLLVFVVSALAGTGPDHATPGTPQPPVAPGSVVSPAGQAAEDRTTAAAARDALAARPMLSVPPSASQPQPLTTATAGPSMTLPTPTGLTTTPGSGTGDDILASGFPRTPEGAVAALAAIDAAAFTDLNPTSPLRAYQRAALPGAVPYDLWTPRVGVTAILGAAGIPGGSPQLTSSWTLTHAQVKGVLDGGDFVLACVLGELDATYRTTVRAGVADCQRMVWSQGRWRIGPGDQPAYPPSTWPGSADCVRAGWREAHYA